MINFLSNKNKIKAEEVLNNINFKGDIMGGEPFIRFWNENSIQLDGDFTLAELKAITNLMESFE